MTVELVGAAVTPVSGGAGPFPEVLRKARRLQPPAPLLGIPVGHKGKAQSFTVRVVRHCKEFSRETGASLLLKVFKTQQGPQQPG